MQAVFFIVWLFLPILFLFINHQTSNDACLSTPSLNTLWFMVRASTVMIPLSLWLNEAKCVVRAVMVCTGTGEKLFNSNADHRGLQVCRVLTIICLLVAAFVA